MTSKPLFTRDLPQRLLGSNGWPNRPFDSDSCSNSQYSQCFRRRPRSRSRFAKTALLENWRHPAWRSGPRRESRFRDDSPDTLVLYRGPPRPRRIASSKDKFWRITSKSGGNKSRAVGAIAHTLLILTYQVLITRQAGASSQPTSEAADDPPSYPSTGKTRRSSRKTRRSTFFPAPCCPSHSWIAAHRQQLTANPAQGHFRKNRTRLLARVTHIRGMRKRGIVVLGFFANTTVGESNALREVFGLSELQSRLERDHPGRAVSTQSNAQ